MATSSSAAAEGDLPGRLAALSLEELGNVRITSVSKRPERLADAAASVYVISRDDIRRSGFTSLAEVLRLAPNLQVAQQSGTGYSISARGFNGSNNSAPNKLLVLIDGRSVYTPLFSGVFWDAQSVMLENIERIEVISGPGGTLWGVNAVNGVINVVTRPAADTAGFLASTSVGERESNAALRQGGSLGANGDWRISALTLDRQHTWTASGAPIDDAAHKVQVGFRADWRTAADSVTVSGNAYRGREGQAAPGLVSVTGSQFQLDDVQFNGANLTAGWERELARGSRLSLQAYADHTERVVPPTFAERLDIVDLQLQQTLAPHGMHGLVWGFNYRRSRDRVDNSVLFAFLPANVEQTWLSVFAQDDIRLADDLDLTIGARLERNDYTGNEFLPNLRLSWKPTPGHLLWAAASRAARTPSRLDVDAHIPGVPPFLLDGGIGSRSEIATVFELGYRGQPSRRTSLSATVFQARYDHLHTVEVDPSFTFLFFGNQMEGTARGVEAWGQFQASDSWRLSAGFTALDEELRLKPGSFDAAAPAAAGNDPSNTWQLHSSWDAGDAFEFDLGVRHAARLEKNAVPAYVAVDMRVAWRLRPDFSLALVGRNLFGRHGEYSPLATRTEHEPSVYLAMTWEP